MEKIDFRNNQQPALNETNLNKLQDNVEDAISESEETQNAKVKTEKTNSDTDIYSCNYINNMDRYSTDEVKTNKVWIDGKPIYKKVYAVSQPATEDWTSINFSTVGLSNIDYIYFANGSRKLESSRYVRDYDYNQNVYLDMTQFKLQIGPTENSQQFTFVFEYTKVTD